LSQTHPLQKATGTPAAQPPGKRSLRGLDWLNFLVAAMQMGFGPFLSVYLTAQLWNPEQIGLAFSIGTAVVLVAQVPAGALVDAAHSKVATAAIAILAIAAAAIIIAVSPVLPVVVAALVLQSAASCALSPAIASITLALAHQDVLGERFGYNVRFAAIGAGVAAALMGAVGYWLSPRAEFFLAAGLGLVALLALKAIQPGDIAGAPSRTVHLSAIPHHKRTESQERFLRFCTDRGLLLLTTGMLLFQLCNAALLPLAANAVTRSEGKLANVYVTAAVVVPQLLTALLSPRFGLWAETWGRRPVVLIGLAAVPIRTGLLAINSSPLALVCFQTLDGISASVIGVMLPLAVADITRRTGRFNLGMGILGLAGGLGATLSNLLGGALANHFGPSTAFFTLGLAGVALFVLAWFEMPDTRPRISSPEQAGIPPPAHREPRVAGHSPTM
jgi:MFS family permease